MKFHHIGIASENIENLIEKLEKYLNITNVSEIVYDANQDARLCMLTIDSGILIELIEGKVVENIIKRRNYLYHTCYSVNNIDKTISSLVNDGAYLIKEALPATLFNGKRVAFLTWDLGMIELVEGEFNGVN